MIRPDIEDLSPNRTPGTPSGKLVVIHATRSGAGRLFPKEFEATRNWFKKTVADDPKAGASAHWVVSRAGQTLRMVPDNQRAAHASQHNPVAWGIELEQSMDGDGFTEPQIASLVRICRGYVEDFGVATVHTLDVTKSGFIGHDETPQGKSVGKTDPGKQFNWARFLSLLKGEGEGPMTTHSVEGAFWANRDLTPNPDANNFTMRARADFNLPPDARRVRLGIYLASGAGIMRFFNPDKTEAEPAGFGGQRPCFCATEVNLAPDGSIAFRVEGGPVRTEKIRTLGFW